MSRTLLDVRVRWNKGRKYRRSRGCGSLESRSFQKESTVTNFISEYIHIKTSLVFRPHYRGLDPPISHLSTGHEERGPSQGGPGQGYVHEGRGT